MTVGPVAPSYVGAAPADAKTTGDGLASKVLVAGHDKRHPQLNDGVNVRFTAWDRDGRLKDSSGNGAALRLVASEFPGWAEGLQLMTVGETRALWVPARLGALADSPTPPRTDLTLVVELLEIVPAPKAPADVKAPPRDAIPLQNGVSSKILAKGAGSLRPNRDSTVTIQYSAWSKSGRPMGSSRTL